MNDGKFERNLVDKALQSVLYEFIKSGIDPLDLADKLYSKQIIDESHYMNITDKHVKGIYDSDRLRDVLSNIKSSAKHDPTVFVKFLAVLRGCGIPGKGIATKLEQKLAAETNVIDLDDRVSESNEMANPQNLTALEPQTQNVVSLSSIDSVNTKPCDLTVDSDGTLTAKQTIAFDDGTDNADKTDSQHSAKDKAINQSGGKTLTSDIILRLPNGAESVRGYQQELSEPGLNGENYIICAPTGSGKTLVAAMIIRNHLMEKRKAGIKCPVLFVVKTQQLAFQQRNKLEEYLKGTTVMEITGQCDNLIHVTLPQVDIVVCTSGKLHSELFSEVVKVSSATLLVLDECHHAAKDDLYVTIMEHYLIEKRLPNSRTPQVIGMTASPGAGRGRTPSLMQAILHQQKLCARLDATSGIKCVEVHKDELRRYVRRPDHNVSALLQRDRDADPFIRIMLEAMQMLEKMLPIKAIPMVNRCSQAYRQWVKSEIESAQIGGIEEQRDQISVLELLDSYALALITYDDFEFKHAMEILKESPFHNEERLNSTDTERILKQTHLELEKKLAVSCSGSAATPNPLLLRCAELLEKHFSTKPDSKGLFFVQAVKHTQFVADWIKSHPKLSKFLKPSSICGHSKKGMTKEEQVSVIEGFRRGDFNLLVSTSVLEEGLDVPECNLIIRFQILSNDIADVQAEGRARAEESTMHTIVISNSNMHYNQLINADKKDLALKAVSCLSQLGIDRSVMMEQQDVILREREERLLAEKNREAQWNAEDVDLLCRKCGTVACNATDVSKYGTNPASPSYIVPSEAFARKKMKKMKRKNNKPDPAMVSDFSRPFKIHCIECNEEWGIWGCWRSGVQYPVLKSTSFTFINNRLKRRENCRQWKKVPFKILFYSDYKGAEDD